MHSIMDPPVGTFAGSIVEPTDVPTEDILPPTEDILPPTEDILPQLLPSTEDILPALDNIPVRYLRCRNCGVSWALGRPNNRIPGEAKSVTSLFNHDLLSRNNLLLVGGVPSPSELLSQPVLVF